MQAIDGKKTDAKPSPAPAGAPQVAAQPTKLEALKRGDLRLRELRNNGYDWTAPAGVSPEQLSEHSTFWNNVAQDLRSGDDVKVFAHDRSWTALYEIVDSMPGYVVAMLAYAVRPRAIRSVDPAKRLPEGWRIERTGPGEATEGWICIGPGEKRILNSGVPWADHESARRGLLDHAIFAQDQAVKYLP